MQIRSIQWTMMILAGLFFLIGCATQQDVQYINNRVHSLEKRSVELQQLNSTLERENAQLKSHLDDYSKVQEEKDQTLRDQSASLQAVADSLRQEIQVLRGKLEETEHRFDSKIKEVESGQMQIGNRMEQTMQQRERVTPQPTEPARVSEQESKPAEDKGAGLTEEELYQMAKQAFDVNDYETAKQGFQEMVRRFPTSRNADNAQFWIGEVYFRQNLYEKAIVEYQIVIEKYPHGNKLQAALLKQGMAFMSLGDKNNARLILQELIGKYPESNEARLAAQKLKNL